MQEILDIGVDVAKAELVIGVVAHPELAVRLPNEAVAIRHWLRSVPAGARLGVESTGPYHALLVRLTQEAGLNVYVLNARELFCYAKALGVRGKTDRTDAQVIARYVHEHHARLRRYQAGSDAQQQIDQLIRRRARLVVRRQSLLRTIQDVPDLDIEREALVQSLQALIHTFDTRIAQLIHSEAELADVFTRLQTIPGVGVQCGAWLTSLLERITFANEDALVAFSGLDPRPRESGQWRGRRRLSKRGPALLRRQLYLSAFSACRTRTFKPVYEALCARGFSSVQALVILARKLLKIAFAVWRNKTVFDPTKLGANTA